MLEEIADGNSDWSTAARADLDYWRGRAHKRVQRDIEELTKMLGEDVAEFGAGHRYTLTTRYLLASRLGAAGRVQDAVRAEDELEWWQQDGTKSDARA